MKILILIATYTLFTILTLKMMTVKKKTNTTFKIINIE